MARVGVTYEEVELAAEKVLQEGESPTIDRVRIKLGGTGSNSTLSKYLNQWKNQRLRASTDILPAIQVPSDPVNEAVKKVWQQLQADNTAKMQELVRATDLRVQTIQVEKHEVEQLLSQTVMDNDSLRVLLRDERAKTDDLTEQVITIKRELAVCQEKAILFEERALHAENTYPSQLQALLEKQQQVEQHYQQQTKEQRADHQHAMDALKEQMENIRHQQLLIIDGLRTELNKSQDQIQKYQETITALQVQKAAAEQERQHLLMTQKEQATLLSHLALLQHEMSQLRVGQASFDNIISDVSQTIADIPTQLCRLETQCQMISQQSAVKTVKAKKVKG